MPISFPYFHMMDCSGEVILAEGPIVTGESGRLPTKVSIPVPLFRPRIVCKASLV